MGSSCCIPVKPQLNQENTVLISNHHNPCFYEFLESLPAIPPFLTAFLSPEFYFKLIKGIPFDSQACAINIGDEECLVGIRILFKQTLKSQVFSNSNLPIQVHEILHIFKNIQGLIDSFFRMTEPRKSKFMKFASKIFRIYLHIVLSYLLLADEGEPWWEMTNIDHFNCLKNELISNLTQLQPSFLSISVTNSKFSQLSPVSRASNSNNERMSPEQSLSFPQPQLNDKNAKKFSTLAKLKPSLESIEEEMDKRRLNKQDFIPKQTSITKHSSALGKFNNFILAEDKNKEIDSIDSNVESEEFKMNVLLPF